MGWLKFAAVAMCVWGSTCFASLPHAFGGERQELQTIQSWMAHLNGYYPQIQVACAIDLKDAKLRQRALFELDLLEQVLRHERQLPPGHLILLSCANIVCGGKGK